MESSTLAAPAGPRLAEARRGSRARSLLRWGAPVAFVVAFTLTCVLRGLPTSRDALFVWIVLGLLAASMADVRRWYRGVVLEWLPFATILFAYDVLRGYADSFFRPHVLPQLRVDEWLAGGAVPTVWLQRHLWDGATSIDWVDYLAWVVYLTHFFATYLIAACLWLFAYHLFRRFAAAVCVLAVAGFTTYAVFPAVPPWMAGEQGYVPHVDRVVGFVSQAAPISFFGSLWERGSTYANDVAAVPSLHAAYSMLIALFFWRLVRPRWRPLLLAYPLAMGWALVYTGEHYLSDVLLGWLYAGAALLVVNAGARRLAARRA